MTAYIHTCTIHARTHILSIRFCICTYMYVRMLQISSTSKWMYFIYEGCKNRQTDTQTDKSLDRQTDDVPFSGQAHGYAGAFLCILGWTQQRRKKISHWFPGATLLRPLPRQRLRFFSHFHLSSSW